MRNYSVTGEKKPIISTVIFGALCLIMLMLTVTAFSQWDHMGPLREGATVVSGARALPENEGKLVVVTGRVTAEGCTVSDEEFDVTVPSPYLARHVEMLQWRNSIARDSDNGRAEAVWWPSVEPDQEIDGTWYRNPGSMPFEGAGFFSDTPAMVGEFELSVELFEKVIDLPGRMVDVTGLPQSGADMNGLELDDGGDLYYYTSDFGWGIAGGLGIGDVRIYFSAADPTKLGEITVMAKQENGILTAYDNEDISPIGYVYDGTVSKEEILGEEESTDNYGAIFAVCVTAVLAIVTAFKIRKIMRISRAQKANVGRGY